MSYKKLAKFQTIINRGDFTYISNHRNMGQVIEIIMYHLNSPGRGDKGNQLMLKAYLDNLDSFGSWFSVDGIREIEHGWITARGELIRVIKLFDQELFKRKSISKGVLKRFTKHLTYGLSRLLSGIRAAFDPAIISNTKITTGQLAEFILNEKVGLGKKYIFNKHGRTSFIVKLPQLNRQELLATHRILHNPTGHNIRSLKGWIDMGAGNFPVRLLVQKNVIGRSRVFFLYTNSDTDKRAYRNQLSTPPGRVIFEAA